MRQSLLFPCHLNIVYKMQPARSLVECQKAGCILNFLLKYCTIYPDRWVRVSKFARKAESFNISFHRKYLNDVLICIVTKKTTLAFNKKTIYADDGIHARKRMAGSYLCHLLHRSGQHGFSLSSCLPMCNKLLKLNLDEDLYVKG